MAEPTDGVNLWGSTDEVMYAEAVAWFKQHPEVTPGWAVLLAYGLSPEFLNGLMADVQTYEDGSSVPANPPMHLARRKHRRTGEQR